jgi:shikimate kinase
MIVLIGPKHSGKTSIGRELAGLLAVPFYDLDALIENQTGQTVRSLYNSGPEIFRHAEEAALREALSLSAPDRSKDNAGGDTGILAVGGGITDNPGALTLLQQGGYHTIVYLDIPAEIAWQRIVREGELPPFLQAETPEASGEKHRLLHQRRSEACRTIAHVCLPAGEKSPAELAAKIRGMVLAQKTNFQ